jgi:mannose-6-phosphate isomerase
MSEILLYPLRFEPIYQYRLWGGRRLADLLSAPLPRDGPIGEAWVLSDRDDHSSQVANGPLKGRTIGQLLKQSPEQLLGKFARRFRRFPLLLKFLDAREMISVQVHPSDVHTDLLPPGETGKTEAWVVLEAETESRVYAGLKLGTTREDLRRALANGTMADDLVCFTPKRGDGVFLPAGTVHTLGDNVVVFEVQQNSDVTFRLYDWGHVDAKTGQPRALQVDQALACVDLADSAAGLVTPVVEATTPVGRERLFHCKHFWLWRLQGHFAIYRRRRGVPRGAGMHRGRGGRARRRNIRSGKRGCVALAGGGRSVCFSAKQCSERFGNFATGIIYRRQQIDGWQGRARKLG